MTDFTKLAREAYAYAENNYGLKDARYDVIVECMTIPEIEAELRAIGCTSAVAAHRWADALARAQHEQELNQAWDGPESCIGSELYDPAYDPSKY